MKRLFYLFSAVVVALVVGSSCTKDKASGGDTTPDDSFATISVVANERYYYNEPMFGTVRSSDVTNATNSINFTVSVDVKDDTDTRDYLIVTMSEELVEKSNLSASSYLDTYLSKVDYMIDMAGLETLKQCGVVQNGDLAESENLFHLYPVFPHEKQYVVCVPFENGELVFSEAAISSAISVTRLVDSSTITIPTDVVSYDVETSVGTETYHSCVVNFTGLESSDYYVYSYMNSSTYKYLSETEIYLRYLEFMNIASYGGYLSDFFAGYYTDLAIPNMISGQTSDSDTLEVGSDNTDYTIYMFRVDEYLEIAGAFKTAEFTTKTYTTPEGDLGGFGDVAVSNDYELDVEIDAGTFEGIYIAQCVSKYEVESAGFSDISDYVANQLELLSYIGMTFTEENEYLDLYTGTTDNFSSNGKTLLPQSDYYIFAAGVDYKGNIITKVISTTFTTDNLSNGFSITLGELTSSSAINLNIASITPTDENVRYYNGLIKSSELLEESDQEKVTYIMKESVVKSYISGVSNGLWLYYDIYEENLEAGTEYVFFTYVVNESGECLYYNSATGTTLAALTGFGDVAVVDYKFNVDVDAGSYDGIYYVGAMSKSLLMSYASLNGTSIMLYLNTYIAEQCSGLTIDNDLVATNSSFFKGNAQNYTGDSGDGAMVLLPDSDYYVFAAGVNASGEVTTDIIIEEFSTPALSGDFAITIKANDTSSESGLGYIYYTPKDKNVKYYYGIIKSSELSSKTDAEIDELIKNATYVKSTTGDYTDYSSYITIQSNAVLTAGTEYTIFTLVLNESDDRLYYNTVTKSTLTSGP